jgi:hypothetical protein
MPVNQTTTEALIQTKVNNLTTSSSLKDVLLICKSIQALRTLNSSLGTVGIGA